MKAIEQYYGPVRRDPNGAFDSQVFNLHYDNECYIKVDVNGRYLHVKQFFPRELPAKVALRECRYKIMREVELEVFGG